MLWMAIRQPEYFWLPASEMKPDFFKKSGFSVYSRLFRGCFRMKESYTQRWKPAGLPGKQA